MNREDARKLISIVSAEKRHARAITIDDLRNILVYKRKFLKEEQLVRFKNECVSDGLLSEEGEKFLINFNAAGVNVPIDFSIDETELFQETKEEASYLDRILDAISASGKMTKKEALQLAKKQLEGLQNIDITIRLCALMNDLYINYSDIKKDMEKDIMKLISLP
jgi:hypothetical protein